MFLFFIFFIENADNVLESEFGACKQMTKKEQAQKNENPEDNIEINTSLQENLKILDDLFRDCSDIIINRLKTQSGKAACIIFIDGLVDTNIVQRDVVSKLIQLKETEMGQLKEDNNIFPVVMNKRVFTMEEVVDNTLSAYTVVLIDGINFAMCFPLMKMPLRSIEEPEVERVIKGQHEGFVESTFTNITLIRGKFKSTKLKVKMMSIGKRSKSPVAMIYVEDIANPEIVKIIEDRIMSIEIDNINGAGYIDQLTADNPYSPFPHYQATERPDKAVANLMEGRIVLLIDMTPVALIAPVNFFQFFQVSDDYNVNSYFGSFLRLLRFFGAFMAINLPALYIAILTYHYQAVPLNLLVPLAESRSRVPFPPIIEALIMEIAFELLREASIRLPSSLGPTVGIVGGLVIGQTAIQAGIVSNIMVIIVGITAIATFVVPQYDMALLFRLGRFIAMINAAIFGIIGLIVFILFVLAHLVSLESVGQPYFQPIAPLRIKDLKDVFVRLPLKMQKERPDIAKPLDKTRGRGNSNGTK